MKAILALYYQLYLSAKIFVICMIKNDLEMFHLDICSEKAKLNIEMRSGMFVIAMVTMNRHSVFLTVGSVEFNIIAECFFQRTVNWACRRKPESSRM